MVRSKEELLEIVKTIIDKTATDDTLVSLVEDIADTMDSRPDVSSYEAKIAELEEASRGLEKMWKEKYLARFFGEPPAGVTAEADSDVGGTDAELPKTYEELFKEVEE